MEIGPGAPAHSERQLMSSTLFQCGEYEQSFPFAPVTMRPFAAIGEVHCCTPLQASPPALV
jgi:hypothetical protein